MFKRTALLIALLGKLAVGATTSCPVSIDALNRDAGPTQNRTFWFSFNTVNSSGRDIETVDFGAEAFDSEHFRYTLLYTYTLGKMPAGGTKKAHFDSHRLVGGDLAGLKVWVKQVKYADASTWADDGKRSCISEDFKRR